MSQTAVAAETLHIPIGMLRSIKAHAVEMRGYECCGLIGGHDGYALMLARCGNRAPLPEYNFFVDPFHHFRAEEAFEKRGFKITAVYHSHPTRGAEPSQSDLTNVPSKFVSLIYSLPADEVKAWRGGQQVSLEVTR